MNDFLYTPSKNATQSLAQKLEYILQQHVLKHDHYAPADFPHKAALSLNKGFLEAAIGKINHTLSRHIGSKDNQRHGELSLTEEAWELEESHAIVLATSANFRLAARHLNKLEKVPHTGHDKQLIKSFDEHISLIKDFQSASKAFYKEVKTSDINQAHFSELKDNLWTTYEFNIKQNLKMSDTAIYCYKNLHLEDAPGSHYNVPTRSN